MTAFLLYLVKAARFCGHHIPGGLLSITPPAPLTSDGRISFRLIPKFTSALSTIAYCYEQQKQYRKALEYYERYLKFVKPGSKGYEFARKSIEFLKGELFMED